MGPFPFKLPTPHPHTTPPQIAQISHSPSPPPTNPASSLKTTLFLAEKRGGGAPPFSTAIDAWIYHTLPATFAAPPCGTVDSGTILPVSQLVAVATQPTLLLAIDGEKKRPRKMEDINERMEKWL